MTVPNVVEGQEEKHFYFMTWALCEDPFLNKRNYGYYLKTLGSYVRILGNFPEDDTSIMRIVRNRILRTDLLM